MQKGRGGMGNSKHRTSGHAPHGADLIQTARVLNEQAEDKKKLKGAQRESVFGSVKALMQSRRKGKAK